MAPLKPFTNFKFKHIFNSFSSSKFIVTKTRILLPPSLELQNGSSKPLFTTCASNLGIIVGVEKRISLDSNPIVPKPKKTKKVEWEFNKMFQNIWATKLPSIEAMMGLNGKFYGPWQLNPNQ
jgi:hypothetical protein